MPARQEGSRGENRRRSVGRSASRGQALARTAPEWWADRWRRWAEEMHFTGVGDRKPDGRIKRLEVGLGVVSAIVQDRKQATCKLEIRMQPWSDAQWDAVLHALIGQTHFATQFAADELPIELDGLLTDVGAPLLPGKPDEVEIKCQSPACPPGQCHHAGLVFAQLADALADDPWMLLRMRGRDQTQLLAGVRKARAGNGENAPAPRGATPSSGNAGRFHRNPGEAGSQEDVPPLTAQMSQFWGVSKALEGFRPLLVEPKVEAVLLRRLGPLPNSIPDADIFEDLAAVYRRVTQEALRQAFAADSDQDK